MELILDGFTKNGLSQITTRHNGEDMYWNANAYNRTALQMPENLFDNINGYLATLSASDQDSIWACYINVKRAIEEVVDTNRANSLIRSEINKLYEILEFEDLRKYLRLHGDLQTPSELKTDMDSEGNDLTEKLTYLKDDYYDLMVYSVLLKPLLPILAEYINYSARDAGTKFRDHYALSFITGSKLIHLPPFARLKVYVDASLEKEERRNPSAFRSSSAVFGGLGSSELPDWLMSKVIIRRIAIYETKPGDSLIANIYHTITQQVNSLDKTFNGRINDKKPDRGFSEDDNASIAENYKVKQEISDGDLAVLSAYTSRPNDMASIVDPTIDHRLVDVFVKHFEQNPFLVIKSHHITLTQWVLAKAISPRGIPLLNKPALLKSMGVTQAILWYWGFEELAMLMSAQPTSETSLSAGVSPGRVSKTHLEKFQEIYPYQRRQTGSINARAANHGIRAVTMLAGELVKTDWILNPPDEIAKQLRVVDPTKPHLISAEIKHHLGELILKTNQQ